MYGIMVTILKYHPTLNVISSQIIYQTRLSITKQFLKSTIRHMFPLFINLIYMCLLYYHHLKGVKRVGCAMPPLTLSLQWQNNLTTEYIFRIRCTFGGNFNLAVLALIAKFNLYPHYKKSCVLWGNVHSI